MAVSTSPARIASRNRCTVIALSDVPVVIRPPQVPQSHLTHQRAPSWYARDLWPTSKGRCTPRFYGGGEPLAPAPISQIQMLVSAEIPRVPRRPGELRRPHRRGSRTNGSSVCLQPGLYAWQSNNRKARLAAEESARPGQALERLPLTA